MPDLFPTAHFHVATEWRLDAPVEDAWNAILLYRDWPTWWRGFRGVQLLYDGDDQGVGTVLRQRWRSRLPYTLTFDLEIVGVERLQRLEGRATGDVDGTATWTFEEHDGWTIVRFALDVRPARWWMRLPVPFARQVFAWNFRTVMDRGHEGLAGLLSVAMIGDTVPMQGAAA